MTVNRHGKTVRWIDYWDGRNSLRTTSIAPTYQTSFQDDGKASRLTVVYDGGLPSQTAYQALVMLAAETLS